MWCPDRACTALSQVMYDTCVGPESGNTVVASFMMLNTKETQATGLSIVFGATPGVEFPGVESEGAPLAIPFDLKAGTSQDFRFEICPESTAADVTVSGEIKYSVGGEEVTQSFSLPMPVSTFTYPVVLSDSQFADMLGGGSLEGKHSISCPKASANFEVVLRYVVCFLHLTVIETHPGAASLAGKSAAGEDLCFLLKCGDADADFSLDGKSNSESRLVSVMTELATSWATVCEVAAAAASPEAAAPSAAASPAPAAAAVSPTVETAVVETAASPVAEEAAPPDEADDDDEFKEANDDEAPPAEPEM